MDEGDGVLALAACSSLRLNGLVVNFTCGGVSKISERTNSEL